MKKIQPTAATRLFCSILLVFGAFLGCRKEEPAAGIDFVYRHTLEVPAGIGVFDVHHFYIQDVPTRFAATIGQEGKTAADILQVINIEGQLGGLFGDENLDFLDQVSIRAYTNGDPTNYVEIAYRDLVPSDPGRSVGLIPSLSDSKVFFEKNLVSFDIVLWLRRTTNEVTPLQLDLRMRATHE
jgi:hypothetical protein